jgi:hypothetical protein
MMDATMWGSPPGLRPTPPSASRIIEQPDQGSGADKGVRPTADSDT